MMKFLFPIAACIILLVSACEPNYYPRPKGFFRLELPDKEYKVFDSVPLPYLFEKPDYAIVFPDTAPHAEPHWIDIHYRPFNASLHFSYKEIDNNLDVYLEDARLFVNKHIPKASIINERLYQDHMYDVYGLLFTIEGTGAASPVQFFLTDSTHHFVRAALYFNFTPNNDSLAPVIEYIKADIEHMVETFRWRQY